jgi:hypothetical protein
MLFVREKRRPWGKRPVSKLKATRETTRAPRRSAARPKVGRPALEGWSTRLKQQRHNLGRAIELLEQATAMATEPRADAGSRAQSLRASALIAMVASTELLVAAGWFEAEEAVAASSIGLLK